MLGARQVTAGSSRVEGFNSAIERRQVCRVKASSITTPRPSRAQGRRREALPQEWRA